MSDQEKDPIRNIETNFENSQEFVHQTLERSERIKFHQTPITLYSTDKKYSFGQGIATNHNLLVYAIKAGTMRCVHKYSAKTVLLRGHVSTITDLRFLNFKSDILVSTSKDNTMRVWRIKVSNKTAEIKIEKLVTFEGKCKTGYMWVGIFEFSPYWDGKKICGLSNKSSIMEFDLDPYVDAEAPKNEKGIENNPVLIFFTEEGSQENGDVKERERKVRKIFHISEDEIRMTSLQFSPCGKYFTYGTQKGYVYLHATESVKNAESLIDYKALYRFNINVDPKLSLLEDVFSLRFLPTPPESDLLNLIVGHSNNDTFSFFSVKKSVGEKNSTVARHQLFRLSAFVEPSRNSSEVGKPKEGMLNICHVISTEDLKHHFLLISNINDEVMYIAKMSSDQGRTGQKFRLTFVNEFYTFYPIVSFVPTLKMGKDEMMLGVFCIQPEKVQLLHISVDKYCLKPYGDLLSDNLPMMKHIDGGIKGEGYFDPDEIEIERELTEIKEKPGLDEEVAVLERKINRMLEEQGKSHIAKKKPVKKVKVMKKVVREEVTAKELEQKILGKSRGNVTREEKPLTEEELLREHTQSSEVIPERVRGEEKREVVVGGVSPELLRTLHVEMEEKMAKRMDKIIGKFYNHFERERVKRLNEEQIRQKELLKVVSKTIMQEIPKQINEIFRMNMPNMTKAIVNKLSQDTREIQKNLSYAREKGFEKVEKSQKKNMGILQNSIKKNNDSSKDFFKRVITEKIKTQISSEFRTFQKRLENRLGEFVGEIKNSVKTVNVRVFKEEKFLQLIKGEKYLEVLERVLEFRDVKKTIWVIKNLSRKKVIENLLNNDSQHVLLSVAQQLSYGLLQNEKEVDLIAKWIKKIGAVVDMKNEKIRNVAKNVVIEIYKNVLKCHQKKARLTTKETLLILNSYVKEFGNK